MGTCKFLLSEILLYKDISVKCISVSGSSDQCILVRSSGCFSRTNWTYLTEKFTLISYLRVHETFISYNVVDLQYLLQTTDSESPCRRIWITTRTILSFLYPFFSILFYFYHHHSTDSLTCWYHWLQDTKTMPYQSLIVFLF